MTRITGREDVDSPLPVLMDKILKFLAMIDSYVFCRGICRVQVATASFAFCLQPSVSNLVDDGIVLKAG